MPTATIVNTAGSDRLAGVSRSKVAMEIPLAKIERDPDQPREEFEPEPLERLAASIRARGVLQPIGVRWVEDRGRYMVIFGERRWRAATMAGLATIPCVVTDRPMAPGERLEIQLVENALREDLKPIEQAKAYRALMDANGWSGNSLAKELGISQSSVVHALAMLDLPAIVQDRVERGELAPSVAYEVSKLSDPVEQAEVARQAVSENMSRADVVKEVRERSAKPKGRGVKTPPKQTSLTIRTGSGFKVTVEHKKGVNRDSLLAVLIEAVASLQDGHEQSDAA